MIEIENIINIAKFNTFNLKYFFNNFPPHIILVELIWEGLNNLIVLLPFIFFQTFNVGVAKGVNPSLILKKKSLPL